MGKSGARVIALAAGLVGMVVVLSLISGRLWGAAGEETEHVLAEVKISEDMTVGMIAEKYGLKGPALKKAFELKEKSDLKKTVSGLGLSVTEAETRLEKALAFHAEESSKNWKKILAKFILWFVFLAFVFVLMRRKSIMPALRKILLLAAVVLFGVILGSDPSPMGTVKDAIVLWGTDGIIFPPRMIALGVFLLMVVLANKFICSWGCQVGTLQELIFRLNRNPKDTKGIMRQYKLPFAFTNSLRVLFFAAITAGALAWAFDIVHPIDPFVIYKPASLGIAGMIFIAVILVASLFVYRPWCTMFCPFGLVGWLFEKISVNRVVVDYDTCIACKACARACPSTVMEAILLRDRTIPDCFSCGTCISTCPTGSISLKSGKRPVPPGDKFSNRKKDAREKSPDKAAE